jgi:hypothetical protein
MRRIVAGTALAAVMFVQGCLRYEVIKPPTSKKQMVSHVKFDFKKRRPTYDKLPLPTFLEKKKKPEVRFITLDRDK